MSNLLTIKLRRPNPPVRQVQRPGLMRRLNEGLEFGRPLTLVSAPAGFGKTTCISEWLAGCGLPAAWLSLNTEDNEPGRFFSYLVGALNQVGEVQNQEFFPQIHEVESMIHSGQLPPAETIANAWMADILEYRGRFILVLDDFHLIQERFILSVFEKLVANLFQTNQNQPLHLVLLTREDPPLPLARLRANNRLTELRAHELRFSAQETDHFLNEVMGLRLGAKDIAALEERTEGWIAGLQLVGLSMQGREDRASFIHGFRGSQRFILSYLTEEVLNQQTEAVQQFLLDTSILERLSGDLCNALTGRSDSAVLLELLHSANLFLVPLDEEQHWYRYHHLFADLLRNRQSVLQGDRTAKLHLKASRWFEQAGRESEVGERADLASQAIRHALAADDYDSTVRIIETHAAELMNQWYIRTVEKWLQSLPVGWRVRSPKTNLIFARLHLTRGNFVEAAPYLEGLEAMFADSQTDGSSAPFSQELRAEWLALQASLLSAQGKPAETLELAKQALEIAGEKDLNTQSQIYIALANAYQQLGDHARAVEAYQQLINLGRAGANLMTELLGISALGLLVIERGQLRYGFELASEGIERMERAGLKSPISTGLYGELGQVSFLWGELDKAEEYLQRAAQASVLGGFSDAAIFYAIARSRIYQMRGDLKAAEDEIQKALQGMGAEAPMVVREEVVAQQVNLYLAKQNLAAAEQALARVSGSEKDQGARPDLEPGQNIAYRRGVLDICALRIQLFQSRYRSKQDGLTDGLELAQRLLAALLHRQYIPLALETLLVRAQLHSVLGDAQSSRDDLTAALDLAEPEGYISSFIMEGRPIAMALQLLQECSHPESRRERFVQKILEAFASLQGLSSPALESESVRPRSYALIEELTERELDVLRLMKEGQTYAEIAERLVVSINTVRSHIKSIYAKLGVNNRTAALETARQLEIR